MKLNTDIYLNKVFLLAKSWGIIHKVKEGHTQNTWFDFDHFSILQ